MSVRLRNIAVAGATGSVGRSLLSILAERKFPINNIKAFASEESLGTMLEFGDKNITVDNLADEDFKNTDIAFFCTSSKISAKEGARAAGAGAVVIDKSSHFRMQSDVPLIVPEANINAITNFKKSNIISSPNCCAIPIAAVLKPLDNLVKIKRVIITTYQSTSGAGKSAMDELYSQTKEKYVFRDPENIYLPRQISFNIIPQIGDFDQNGDSDEEVKICQELTKILGSDIKFTANCARVPVFIGHSMYLNIEFTSDITNVEAREVLSESSGISLNKQDIYSCPTDVVGEDAIFVSRLRKDASANNALSMWISSDNLRKGAALNAVQIAEEILTIT